MPGDYQALPLSWKGICHRPGRLYGYSMAASGRQGNRPSYRLASSLVRQGRTGLPGAPHPEAAVPIEKPAGKATRLVWLARSWTCAGQALAPDRRRGLILIHPVRKRRAPPYRRICLHEKASLQPGTGGRGCGHRDQRTAAPGERRGRGDSNSGTEGKPPGGFPRRRHHGHGLWALNTPSRARAHTTDACREGKS
jgi:hypothetical protein